MGAPRVSCAVFALLISLAACGLGHAEGGRADAESLPRELRQTLEALQQAVDQRDRRAVLELVDEECGIAHGGFHGREGFRLYWFGVMSPGGDLFELLGQALGLGGAFAESGQDLFFLPYVALAPTENAQGELLGAVVARKALVRERPGLQAPVLQSLGPGAVRYCSNRFVPYLVDGVRWVCVLDGEGAPGFTERANVRSPLDTAFVLGLTGEGWRIVRVQ